MTYKQRITIIRAATAVDQKPFQIDQKLMSLIPKGFEPGCRDWNSPGKSSYRNKWLKAHGYEI